MCCFILEEEEVSPRKRSYFSSSSSLMIRTQDDDDADLKERIRPLISHLLESREVKLRVRQSKTRENWLLL